MTTTLVVLAHPSQRSFNSSWADATVKACKDLGDTVLVSDLCTLEFDPSEKASHYKKSKAAPFDVLKAQESASLRGELPSDVTTEINKIEAADRIIIHFPIWWFSPPAILKGWCERVLVNGGMHSVDARFDLGKFRGKTVLFCVTTGSKASESAPNGKEGNIAMLLWPLAYTFRYLGFDIAEPRIVHGVHGYHTGEAEIALQKRLKQQLDEQASFIAGFDTLPLIKFNADSDFDETGTLQPDATSHTPFIQHLID